MSKPLELAIYPKRLVETGFVRWNGDGTSTDLHVEEWLIDGVWVRGPFRTHKRLTDAELAAELHRAASVEYAAIADPSGFKPGAQQRAAIQCQVLHRFAELSHYDEVRA